jgi:hypothetical protein
MLSLVGMCIFHVVEENAFSGSSYFRSRNVITAISFLEYAVTMKFHGIKGRDGSTSVDDVASAKGTVQMRTHQFWLL